MIKLINRRMATIWIWVVIVLSSSSWVLVGSVGYWVEHKWLPADSAGWAQAVGVILGIFVAIMVPAIQGWQRMSDQRAEDLQSRRHSIKAVRSLLGHLEYVLQRVQNFYSPKRSSLGSTPMKSIGDSIWHDLKSCASMLNEVPITALTTEMVEYMVLIRHIANYGEHLSGSGNGLPLGDMDLVYVENEIRNKLGLIETIKKNIDSIESEINAKSH